MTPWFAPTGLEFQSIPVGDGAAWVTLELTDGTGLLGTAETIASWQGRSVPAVIARLGDRLRGRRLSVVEDVTAELQVTDDDLLGDFVTAAAVSALRGAVVDALARREELPLHSYLRTQGTEPVEPNPSVRLYANINRALLPLEGPAADRSPPAFAAAARAAVRAGFPVVKCAPFDECHQPYEGRGVPPSAQFGLERIGAVVEAVGPDTAVYVDCHRRFDLPSSQALAGALADFDVAWFEEPMDPATSPGQLAQVTAVSPVRVAGGERGFGHEWFDGLLEQRVVDVAMPDVMFCGGPAEAYLICREHPGRVSLHCSSGPLALLAGAHVTSAGTAVLPLEHAVHEVPWRSTVLEVPERIVGGVMHLPDGPGLGTRVDRAVADRLGGRRWVE